MNEISRRTAMFARASTQQADLAVDAASQARLADIKIDAIMADPENPRRHFDQAALESLAESLRANGMLQPIVVRPGEGGQFILIAGERRWRAGRLAGFATIKAIIRPNLGEASALLLAQVAENEAREDLTTADLVAAVGRLVALGIAKKQIAAALATDPSRIARIHALSDLPAVLAPLLDKMAIEPLYELLQHHKRAPEQVATLLDAQPIPTRSAIRALAGTSGSRAGEGGSSLPVNRERPFLLELAPAQGDSLTSDQQLDRRTGVAPKHVPRPPSVQVIVRHDKHGEGRVVASASIISNRLPIMFSGSDTPVQVLLGELNIVSIR